jgi:hypothetical protein
MILEVKLKLSLLLKGGKELWIDNNIGDRALLENDTISGELTVEIIHHVVSHIGLKIKYLVQPNSVDEVSHVLFNFSGKKLVETTGTKFVDENLDHILSLWKSESEMDINIYVSVILGWASLNWSIIVNNVPSKEACNSLVTAVTPLSTCWHHSVGCTTDLFEHGEICWNIHLNVTATALVASLDHANNALFASLSGIGHLLCSVQKTA